MPMIPIRCTQPPPPPQLHDHEAACPWEPWRELRSTSFCEGPAGAQMPSFEARETLRSYRVRARLPGVAPNDLSIAIAGARLIISGITPQRGAGRGASFRRSYLLPSAADACSARAGLRSGVLSVVVPKVLAQQPSVECDLVGCSSPGAARCPIAERIALNGLRWTCRARTCRARTGRARTCRARTGRARTCRARTGRARTWRAERAALRPTRSQPRRYRSAAYSCSGANGFSSTRACVCSRKRAAERVAAPPVMKTKRLACSGFLARTCS
jgi:HSP20 family molecular chaperone IbpA